MNNVRQSIPDLEQMLSDSDPPLKQKTVVLFLAVVSGLMALSFYLHVELPLFLAVSGVFAVFLVLQHPIIWIIVSILLFIPVFWNPEEGLTLPEVVHVIVYYGGIIVWFFHRLIIRQEKISWTAGSIMLMLLFAQMLVLTPISMTINADPYIWLREMVILSTVLMLIPISHECNTRARQYAVGGAFIIVLTALSLRNIIQYKQKVVEAVWVWQVGASRASETFFLVFTLAVLGLALLLSTRKPISTLIAAAVLTAGAVATVLTFYRTLWVATLGGYFLMGLILGKIFLRRVMGYLSVVVVIVVIAYPIFLSDVVPLDVMWNSVSSRFESIGGYKRDLSVTNRDAETRTILADIEGHWLLGKGIAVTTPFRKLITKTTIYPTWTHNGYAWVLKHFGIIGTIFLFSAWLFYVRKGIRIARYGDIRMTGPDADRLRIRLLAAGGSAVIVSTFLVSFTINQFLSHEAGFAFAVIFGLFEALDKEMTTRSSEST